MLFIAFKWKNWKHKLSIQMHTSLKKKNKKIPSVLYF